MQSFEAVLLMPLPTQKLAPKFLPSQPRQKKITHARWQHSFENLCPPTEEKDGGLYFLLYQNLVRKNDDDFEN